eukprot:CAMPEP_0201914796 /NCGR_PEP_ID=MMETSP0903-20130614/4887_1 /ASSEMBLY_ACC=CAM_ASM_000552 /TAXON_ID=420261 /ORGANISM="Thalassiosira antarctica, Strain CCMP982" /LENGTH=1016 /DNA_ID=CAMNT_0048450253 /DNA_START=196 /DNA_END=3247 /DNA_ORIENTATION=+
MANYQEPNNEAAVAVTNRGARPNNLPATNPKSPPLQRNPSVTSTHSYSSSIGITSRTVFPASPALSTLSKNSSSGNSSLASSSAANKMSVDDILSSSKMSLTGRQKRMRIHGGNNMAMAGKPAVAVYSSRGVPKMRAQTTASSSSARQLINHNAAVSGGIVKQASAKRRLPNLQNPLQSPKYQNSGQEERKKRLERLQQQQFQQRLGGQGQTPKRKAQPLTGLIKLEQMKLQEEEELQKDQHPTEEVDSGDRQQYQLDEQSQKSHDESQNEQVNADKTHQNNQHNHPKNLAEEEKKNKQTQMTAVTSSPPPAVKSSPAVEIQITKEANDTRSKARTGPPPPPIKEELMMQQPEEPEEPESALSALTTLLLKYNSCTSQTLTKEGEEEVTPWNIVQLLTDVLRFINLHDPDFVKSEECRQVEVGLAGILKSVATVKWEVMNRNNNNEPTMYGEDEQEGSAAKKEARLLQTIQIQVWIRMMVWSLEQEVGWEFLGRVIALAEAKAEEAGLEGAVVVDKKGKKKGKKNKKKSKQTKQQSNSTSPRQSLVADVRTLAELAPYVLPPSLEFAQWLKSTLTYEFRQTIPQYGAKLFDHFEIEIVEPIALKRSGTDASNASRRSERSEVSRSPVKGSGKSNASSASGSGSPTKQMMNKRQKSQQAYYASLAEEEKASQNSNTAADDETATITGSLSTFTSASKSSSFREKDDTILFKTSMSLVASTSHTQAQNNPFLKGSARGNYVGTHFTSKLTNITTLFREVKAAPAKKKVAPPAVAVERKRKNALGLDGASSVRMPAATIAVAASAQPRGKYQRKGNSTRTAKTIWLSSSPSKSRFQLSSPPKETPRKRHRPSASSRGGAGAPLFQVDETPLRPIIEETPAAKQPRPRLILRDDHSYSMSVAETPQQQQPLPRGGGPMASLAVQPTALWGDGPARSSRKQSWDDPSHHHPQRRRQRRNSGNGSEQQLTPVNKRLVTGAGRAPPPLSLSFGLGSLSPMPHQADLGSVVAQAARAHNARKKK